MAYEGKDPARVYKISTAAQLSALATGGVIALTSDTQINFQSTSPIITTVPITHTNCDLAVRNTGEVIYVGGGTFITGFGDANFLADGGTYTGATTGNFYEALNCYGNRVDISDVDLQAWNKSFNTSGHLLVVLHRCGFFVWGDTNSISARGVRITLSGTLQFVDTGLPLFDVTSDYVDPRILVSGWLGSSLPNESLIRIDPSLPRESLISVTECSFGDSGVFDTSGSTGTFTDVDIATVGSTAITGVTDDGDGLAKFAFTGPTVYVNEKVTLTTTNSNYDGDAVIIETDETTYFKARQFPVPILFDTPATGTFTSDRVIITDVATTLVNGDRITLDTDSAIDYDGGVVVYNKQTDSFMVNKTWTQARTGTWSAKGLDQYDPRVLASIIPSISPSQPIAYAHIEGNTTSTTIALANIYQDINVPGRSGAITLYETNGAGGTRVTSAGHAMLENQNIRIASPTYTGLYTIFNVTANTFDIAKSFTVNDATGTWYIEVSFETNISQRFKPTDLATLEITCIATERVTGFIEYIFVHSKAGADQQYLFAAAIDNTVPQHSAFARKTVTTNSDETTLVVPIDVVYGQRIKPKVAGLTTNPILATPPQVH